MSFSYLKGHLELFSFYLKHLSTIQSLPRWMRNPDCLSCEFSALTSSTFSLHLPSSIALTYNAEMDKLKARLRSLHADTTELLSYRTTLALLMVLRLICIYSACRGHLALTLLLASLQFVLVPYSFFVSFTLSLALAPPIYASHYISFTLTSYLQSVVSPLLPSFFSYMFLPITPTFIFIFFVLDQCFCLRSHLSHHSLSKDTIPHIVWGFLNTKTYHLVLLLLLCSSGFNIPVLPWLLDIFFNLTPRLASLISRLGMHWAELFYHQHRMAHLPRVYDHAHKLHHYLHGSTSFDAHIYGNGMPEEFFFLCLETCLGVMFGMTPASFNRFILQHSLDNKIGHTKREEDLRGENFHVNHHIHHVKNYGIYNCLMDMYFGTCTTNEKYTIKPNLYSSQKGSSLVYSVEKEEKNGEVIFHFTSCPHL